MKPVMDRNIPFTIISSIALTVPPILYNIIGKVLLAVVPVHVLCLPNETLDLQIVSAQK